MTPENRPHPDMGQFADATFEDAIARAPKDRGAETADKGGPWVTVFVLTGFLIVFSLVSCHVAETAWTRANAEYLTDHETP